MINVLQASSWRDVKGHFDDSRESAEFIWRGHGRADWTLSSSLYRYFEAQGIPSDARRAREAAAVEQFGGPTLAPGPGAVERRPSMAGLPSMQHHGCPTRLIDWTWSPYVASYFVLPDMVEVGAVYGLNLTVYQDFLAPRLPLDDYDGGLLPSLPDRIFARFLNTPDLVHPVPIASASHLGRATEQQSVFLLDLSLSDSTEALLADLPVPVLIKIEIPRAARLEIHADLLSMNIDGAHLFPGEAGRALRAKEWLFGARWHGHSIKTDPVTPWT